MEEALAGLRAIEGALKEWTGLKRPQILEYPRLLAMLGVSPSAPDKVLRVCEKTYEQAYPPHWSEEKDESSGAVFFYHAVREESSWDHPMVDTFREILDVVEFQAAQRRPVAELGQRIEAVLTDSQVRAANELTGWIGPIEAGDGAVFYYNDASGDSSWEDPREKWQYDLQVRYEVLLGFLVAEERDAIRRESSSVLVSTLNSTMHTITVTLQSPLKQQAAPDDGATDDMEEGVAPPRQVQSNPVKTPPLTPQFGESLPAEDEAFQAGVEVEAHSLSAMELNGRRGRVLGRQGDRVRVEFEAPFGVKALRDANLRLLAANS